MAKSQDIARVRMSQEQTIAATTLSANGDTKRPRRRSGSAARTRAPAFDARAIERRWRERWEQSRVYQPSLTTAPRPYYNLMMFPYPSAEGLHVGNMYSYIGSDVHGRFMAMQGYDVFEPIGFDAFGIHSENFAIKQGEHPYTLTAKNVANFRRQLHEIGNRFDWSHDISSTDPAYYRWTQWIFVKLFKAGLAERRSAPVNWCPNDKTVLADEQVIDGRCERCGAVVERRELEQWFLKITRFAARLLANLDELDWTARVKALQRNWIGRSEGLEFTFAFAGVELAERIAVFTTRPDTIYGATFVVLAPEHPLADAIGTPERRETIAEYRAAAERARIGADPGAPRPVTGVFTGAYAMHPLSGERLPVWVADYVMMEVGTGAIMGVPAHDTRDYAFATAMGLPIRRVVRPTDGDDDTLPFTDDGVLANSGNFTRLPSAEARAAIADSFEAHSKGHRRVTYHLRDWLISRQRYWGPPIPIIYCPEHGAVPVPEEDLPVVLPYVENYRPTGTGVSPLASVSEFVETTCPICGKPARRETDVSDNFLDSAWYFLRYPSSDDEREPWNPELTRKWLPPQMYIGGAEHSVLHLMYARFITMAMHELGYLDFEEPFPRFRANGIITASGAKISKSHGNTINPDVYVRRYGADVFRTYLLFMGPYEAGGEFNDRGLGGVVRFLDRVWRFTLEHADTVSREGPDGERRRVMHSAIRQVTEDTAALKYNTAIAALMKYLNELERQAAVALEELTTFVRLLAPYAPFITEELWHHLGHTSSIHTQSWPQYDEAAARADTVTVVVQVNGRLRDRLVVPADLPETAVTERALALENVQRHVRSRAVRNVIYVPGRLVNLVLA
jgi:leucyl-tRNA synthetase